MAKAKIIRYIFPPLLKSSGTIVVAKYIIQNRSLNIIRNK